MTCRPKSLPRPVSLQMIVFCTATSRQTRTQSLYKMTSTSYRTGKADWQMHFNPDKCELIRITNKRKIINATYLIHNVQLKRTKRAKYLGLTYSNTLSWNTHIDTITKKANNTTAFLRRNQSTYPKKVKDTCYRTFVRPQVEYGATVFDPHTTDNIKKVEAVQRRAARFVTGDYRYTSSVTAMTKNLSWETLRHRRQQA